MVLQSIRERLSGIMAFFILGILIIPFAFVGVSSYFSSGTENLVARVNDTDITLNEFQQSFSGYRNRMRSLMGASFDPVAFESLVERRRHLDAMIDRELLTQAVARIGLDVDDRRLAQEIRELPAFQLDGQFSQEVYLNRLAGQGLSVSEFENQMRTQFIMDQLPSGLLASSFATRGELERFVRLQEQERSFRSVMVDPIYDEPPYEPSEDEVVAWYESKPERFQSEEQVVIEYLELDAVDIDTGTDPDDEFLRARFEDQKGRFISPEQRQVSHILIEVSATADEAVIETARQEAEAIAQRARAGEDFAELARTESDDIGSSDAGGDLGWLEPGIMPGPFEDAMYALTADNPISDPVQTSFGWHVIQLRDVQESSGMSFEEARTVLIEEYRQEEAEREFLDKADVLIDLIYEDPTTLEAAALDLGLEVQTEGPFSRAGGEGIAGNPEVVTAAFSDLVKLQGSASDPIDLGDNHLVVIRLREHLPAALQPLDAVREQVVQQIRDERASQRARELSEQILASVAEGATLEDAAAEHGLEVQASDGIKRRSFVPDTVLVGQVFDLPAPETESAERAVLETSTGFAVVELTSVKDGSLDDPSQPGGGQFRRQIANAVASVEARGFMEQLRERAVVEVFEERLQ
ncbi:MAG: SurA N-terminal domain-containing protein [Xanthomonadales bacterium]|nr:SurA N-terminal domain-containing protein [Xanthomonadales bacterium]